jgi:hypothetical protein
MDHEGAKWVARYRKGDRNRSRSFSRKGDAERFDVETSRRREPGALGSLDGGRETVDDFVTQTWAPTHGMTLAPKTRKHYALLRDHHIAPTLGSLQLRASQLREPASPRRPQRDLSRRQLGHDARLTLTRYCHVIDELEDQPQIRAEQAIREARSRLVPSPFPRPTRRRAPSRPRTQRSPAKAGLLPRWS